MGIIVDNLSAKQKILVKASLNNSDDIKLLINDVNMFEFTIPANKTGSLVLEFVED